MIRLFSRKAEFGDLLPVSGIWCPDLPSDEYSQPCGPQEPPTPERDRIIVPVGEQGGDRSGL